MSRIQQTLAAMNGKPVKSVTQGILDGSICILRDVSVEKANRDRATELLVPLLPEINALGFIVHLTSFPRGRLN